MSNSHPPHNAAALPAPILPEGISNGVTKAYLAAHNDRVAVTVPHFPGQAVGDLIAMKIGGPNAEPIAYQKVNHAEGSTKVEVLGQNLTWLSNGAHLTYYTITSSSGHEGPNSNGTFIRLNWA